VVDMEFQIDSKVEESGLEENGRIERSRSWKLLHREQLSKVEAFSWVVQKPLLSDERRKGEQGERTREGKVG